MRRRPIVDVLFQGIFYAWLVVGATAFAPLLERGAFAQGVITPGTITDNTCQAPPIPGNGCPANGNGCAACTGPGWSCQSAQPDDTCTTGTGGCANAAGCLCNSGSC